MSNYTLFDNEYELKLRKANYANNNTLAVLAYIVEDGREVPFCDVTVNIDWPGASDTMAFIDEPNCPGIGAWLERNHIAIPTPITGYSGFNSYPLYLFCEEALNKIENEV